MAPKRKNINSKKTTNKKRKLQRTSEETINDSSHDTNESEKQNSYSENMKKIQDLNVKLMDWTIKARVIAKFPIKSWEKNDTEGSLFNLKVIDETGEIRITGFNELIDKFYDKIEIDNIYYFKKGQIRLSNKL